MVPKDKILESLLVCMYWIKSKESPSILRKPEKHMRKLFKDIVAHQNIIHLLDKDVSVSDASQAIVGMLENKRLKDSSVLAYLDEFWGQQQEDDLKDVFEVLSYIINLDNKVSVQETESLKILQHRFDLSDEFIERIQSETSKKSYKKVIQEKESRRGLIPWKFAMKSSLVLLTLIIMSFTGYSAWIYMKEKNDFLSFNMADYIKNKPQYVFKRASFYKYVIHGTSDTAHKYFKKLSMFHVKGSADFQFDMTGLEIDKVRTDFVGKILHLKYTKKDLPLTIDVNIDPGDVYEMPDEELPDSVSVDDADAIAKCVSVPAALTGAVVGGKVGSIVGGAIYSFPGRIIAGILGAGGGAAAAGTSAYIMTNNFFTGLKLSDGHTLGDKDKIIESCKPLIALELMGGGMMSSDSWSDEVKKYYRKEFEENLRQLFRGFGWKDVIINYDTTI